MPCSDSSSSIALRVDHNEHFISFDFAKITCGREITGSTGFSRYCVGKPLLEILSSSFAAVSKELSPSDEESNFILYLEWDALRCAIGQYLGESKDNLDIDRCMISSVEDTGKEIEITMVILPPKELPKILPCSLGDKKQ